MKRFVGWLFSSLGYVLYTVLVLVVLLWVLFPVDRVRVWLQAQINSTSPSFHWEIGALQRAWPISVVASGIRLKQDEEDREPLVQIDEVKIMPDIGGVLGVKTNIPVRYRVKILEGTVRGTGSYFMENGLVQCIGDMEGLELDKLKEIWRIMNRQAAGTMSGPFSYEGPWRKLPQGSLQSDLAVTDGVIALHQPVFGLSQLEFSRMTATLSLRDQVIALEEGAVESKMLAGEYSGTVSLTAPPLMSEVKINGSIEPRPELLGSIKDSATLALIRNQLKENKLSFAISGTLLEPGITFQGASGVIDGIIEGGAR